MIKRILLVSIIKLHTLKGSKRKGVIIFHLNVIIFHLNVRRRTKGRILNKEKKVGEKKMEKYVEFRDLTSEIYFSACFESKLIFNILYNYQVSPDYVSIL